MEKKNVDLIARGRGAGEAEMNESYRSCCELLCRRGTQFAPAIEGKIDSKELIDVELREALRRAGCCERIPRSVRGFNCNCMWYGVFVWSVCVTTE